MQMQIFKFMIIIKDVTSLHHDTSKAASLYLLYAFSWSITAIAEIIYFKVCFRKLRIAA